MPKDPCSACDVIANCRVYRARRSYIAAKLGLAFFRLATWQPTRERFREDDVKEAKQDVRKHTADAADNLSSAIKKECPYI